VTSGLDTVAVRMPAHPIAREVIRLSGLPVAAPSANPFGYLSPTRAEHVALMLGDKVDFILDGGPCEIGVESTVLDVTGEVALVLRPGGMPLSAIEAIIGKVEVIDRNSAVPTSPGQLDSHYAPRLPLRLLQRGGLGSARPGRRAVAIFFDEASRLACHAQRRGSAGVFAAERVLSPAGDLREAAAALFDLLHELDAGNYDEIWAERVPDGGLGLAVNDRLWKASRK
jgi:L-threonylcarbamoyladenylate synthase